MRPPIRPLIIAAFLFFLPYRAFSADVKVIANPALKADLISAEELRGVFLLQRKTLNDGTPVVPVVQKPGAVSEAFSQQYLERSSDELQAFYQTAVRGGRSVPPKELPGNDDVVAYVARTRGAIGYVSLSTITENVKVLVVVAEERSERVLVTRVEPDYPETLRKMKIGGIVRLRVTVSPQGRVETVSLLGGNPILSDAGIKAVRQWVYAPAPSSTTMQVTLRFNPHHE